MDVKKMFCNLQTMVLCLFVYSISLQAQSRYCWEGAKISLKGGGESFAIPASVVGNSRILRVTVSPLVTRYSYLVTNESNSLLQVSSSNFIEIAGLGPGKYRIWALSHVGRITATIGENVQEDELASFCYELTANFVSVEIVDETAFKLQLLHHGGAASALRNVRDDLGEFGGVHRFRSVLEKLRNEGAEEGYESVLISAGDNLGAGKDQLAGIRLGQQGPVYEALAQRSFGYDAIGLGDRDFEFGPFVLEKYIRDFSPDHEVPFVGANLDLIGEPGLSSLADQGRIRASVVVAKAGEDVGIIGVSPPGLELLSSPRNARASDDVIGFIGEEVDRLTATGVNKIILISHLADFEADLDLASRLRDIDVVVAGGGDEFLSNRPEEDAMPGFVEPADAIGEYPLAVADADGKTVYVVSTPGSYSYIGNLKISFNRLGDVTEINDDSGPVFVQTDTPDQEMESQVVQPVADFVNSLGNNILGATEIELSSREEEVRTLETNGGNLVADALLWQANFFGFIFGASRADIAIQHSGAFGNSVVVPPLGRISELTTFDMLPTAEFVSIVEAVSASQLKSILEHAVSAVENESDRFVQVAGIRIVYDPTRTPRTIDEQGNILTVGSRIISIVLNDGRALVENGEALPNAPSVNLATSDFIARGGNGFPLGQNELTNIGISLQQALASFLVFQLRGAVAGAAYPEGGEGRIQAIGQNSGISIRLPSADMPATEVAIDLEAGPNPFAGELNLVYRTEQEADNEILLIDIFGRKVADLYAGRQPAGQHQLKVNVGEKGLPRGTYLVLLKSGDLVSTVKLSH